MPTYAFVVAALLSFCALLNAQTITPSNTTTYTYTSTAERVVLALYSPQNYYALVDPLTPAALSVLPNATNTQDGRNGVLQLVGPGTTTGLNRNIAAFISCDPSFYQQGLVTMSTVIDNAINANVSSIIFFSLDSGYCSLNGSYSYPYMYTMSQRTTPGSGVQGSVQLYQRLAGTYSGASSQNMAIVMTAYAYLNATGNTPTTTAVAMIILYSVTGIISALFLAVIISGTLRAHRHPERYGAINVLGRPRQSRAKGLARAMLETIPVVKFGDKMPENKPGDVELGSADAIVPVSHGPITTDKNPEEGEREVMPTPLADGSADPIAAAGAGKLAATETDDENPMCSICTDDFERGQDIRVLPCNHKFHAACVDPWLLDVSGTCPLCRVDLRGHGTVDGESSTLAPPVASDESIPSSRRSRLRTLFNPRALQNSTPEQRLSVLRQFRRENAGPQVGAASTENRGWSRFGGAWSTQGRSSS